MKKGLFQIFLLNLLLINLVISGNPGQNLQDLMEPDPRKARLVYQDVENFINIYPELLQAGDPHKFIEEKYFKPGTKGLKIFIKKYNLTAERLWKAVQKQSEKYGKLKEVLHWLKSKEPSIRKSYKTLKKFIPTPIYPPTFFMVGAFRGIGSGSEAGQLITIEKWEPESKKHLNTLLVHELVHLNQAATVGMSKYRAIYGPEKSLLALCVREGIAEFFAYLVTGRTTQDEALNFLLKHEKRFKEDFKKDMLEKETKDWMWKKPKDPLQPMHIGYSLGFRIAQSFYQQSRDKIKAVRALLSVTDYPSFLKKSLYLDLP
jgi:hypothetical protein